MSWPRVELSSVAPAKAKKHALAPDDKVWILGLDQIEADTGVLLNKVVGTVASAGPSTHGFDERHVLYSKLRPYLNKVVLPDEMGLATTELVPMLPDPLKLDRNYLAHYLRSKNFVDWVSAQVAGAKMPRVSMGLFWKHEIPLPPLLEQKRIAAILDKADAIRRKRQQAIQLADDFLRAVFLDMFGDPVTNPKGWNIVELSTLVDPSDRLNYGVVQPGENDEDGIPLVRSGDLADFTPDVNQLRRVSTSIDTKHRRSRLKGNEILIACVGSIGRVGWVSEEMIGWNIARAVTRIPIREGVNREYVYRYLQNPVVQGYFERETRAVAQPTLNVGLIAKTPIAVPPHELQTEFLKRYQTIQSYKNRLMSNLEAQDKLAGSLSQKAFRGEL